MKTLVIYDNNGIIFTQMKGNYVKPVGLQHIEIEIPKGKILKSVNATTHEPIYEDVPPSDIDLLRLEMAQANTEMFEMIMSTGGTLNVQQ